MALFKKIENLIKFLFFISGNNDFLQWNSLNRNSRD